MNNSNKISNKERIAIIEKSAKQVGKPVVHAILIIVVSFIPVFLLTGQEGKLFHPLAWTKTMVMASSMILAITLIPVLMVLLMRGKMRPESKNPVSNFFVRLYEPVLSWCLKWKKTVLTVNIIALVLSIFLLTRMGSQFMPPLDEGTILFMPVALPDASNAEMKRILQVQDKIISSSPEVKNVLGKAGRINSATDNAPISMVETIVLLKPKSEWRAGMTKDKIISQLNERLQIPGVTNGWTQPIINRINMLSTGIRTDVGVKIFGQNLDTIYRLGQMIAGELKGIKGITDLYPEQITGGKYLNIEVNKDAIGRYGLTTDDVNSIVQSALGGMNVGQIYQGRERFSVNVRLAQDWRASLEDIKGTLVQTKNGPLPLSDVASISLKDGPSMISSENALLRGTVLFDVRGRDLGSTVKEAMQKLDKTLTLPKGYFINWSGQWENQLHAQKTLELIIPVAILLILLILYFTFHDLRDAFNTILSVPFAFVGGILMVYLWGENLSVAVAVGFIALFGVAVETGVVMMIYLEEAMQRMVREKGTAIDVVTLRHYVLEGAVKRLRPKLMTVCVALFGLVPVLWSNGTGIELMRPVALPMIGGMVTSAISILLVMPIIFELFKENELKKHGSIKVKDSL
ncbi:Cu(I)/Ag(I) efflux system membrane protein CusA/SilA [Arachidicoccus rhizosphaerae]|jgi:Cu(I)/Ag(I) efflux system membrane protein CusA/SilA|uniref:Cu(I)/Ag(I) efflux system membrane protein CusA/SilA n=1 Tax=Arachidicoccus rhizosphaerae TaxID=551991 RepID=A0A1H4CRP6_9BACT|nr:efflux RND transporter permease subunit [Arachidicoccus rhizosphaerae]SEA63060.1 Cu(I)/Ag(I) efflux system membrane protein CusA/SilA [Arachidicoccus rhizosphaerae]